ncbi:right-handed parallel beta-helix repeat-containing protein [Micromonospora sp. NPDC049559]|uniref:right-handed parallel beta-helix repeat-containing protein n=1 Tax=Micromonospora sp. NPDC049559 TaxID=3155923 RepID=UPI00342B81CF
MLGLVVLTTGTIGVGAALADSPGSSAPPSGSMTVTTAGAVVADRVIHGYLHIRADNVIVRNVTVRYGGSHAVRVFDGFTGIVIEDSRIYCEGDRTNGVVFGNYLARRVTVVGCRKAFMYGESAPAEIVDSTWNGEPVAVVEVGLGAGPSRSGTATLPARGPTPGATATAREGAAATAGAGHPGPDDTGVPAGTTLKRSGSLTLTRDGQVVSGLDIVGCVTVTARDVVIQRSRITCGGPYSIKTFGSENLLVQDVEIDGMGRNGAAVCCDGYTLRRVEIRNVIDGPRLSDNTVVEDSWIHHLVRVGDSHNDALQTTGASNIVVRGNTLEAYNPDIDDPLNACLMLGSTTGPVVSNLVFEENYCNGGNYSIGIRTDLRAVNVKIQNNVFGRDCRFGIVARPAHPGILWHQSTNVWADNRKPVVR